MAQSSYPVNVETITEMPSGVSPTIVGEAPAGHVDLSCLSPQAGVAGLVVAAKKQDDAVAHGVAEDAQEDVTAGSLCRRREPRLLGDRVFVVPDSELEQTVTKLSPILRGADADTFGGQKVSQSRHHGLALCSREVAVDPAPDWLVPVGGAVVLQSEETVAHSATVEPAGPPGQDDDAGDGRTITTSTASSCSAPPDLDPRKKGYGTWQNSVGRAGVRMVENGELREGRFAEGRILVQRGRLPEARHGLRPIRRVSALH
jgi:hypothetical protein